MDMGPGWLVGLAFSLTCKVTPSMSSRGVPGSTRSSSLWWRTFPAPPSSPACAAAAAGGGRLSAASELMVSCTGKWFEIP